MAEDIISTTPGAEDKYKQSAKESLSGRKFPMQAGLALLLSQGPLPKGPPPEEWDHQAPSFSSDRRAIRIFFMDSSAFALWLMEFFSSGVSSATVFPNSGK